MPNSSTPSTVLVLDASPITLLGTAGVLDTAGHACICARTPEAACQAAEQDGLDAAVIDVGDDAEATLELITQLREFPQHAQLPIVLLADSCWAGLEKRCETLDWVRCLFKPIDPNVLIDITGQMLWLPRLEQQHRRRGSRPTRPGWVEL